MHPVLEEQRLRLISFVSLFIILLSIRESTSAKRSPGVGRETTTTTTAAAVAADVTPCPSGECDCRLSGQPGEIMVRCPRIGRHLPDFDDVNATFGSMSLARSNITALTGRPFENVQTRALDLSGNPMVGGIADEVFFGLESVLQVLSLSDCSLNRVPWALARLTQMRTLHLDGNRITNVPKGTFRKNQRLTQLFLHRNTIRRIDGGSLEALAFLEELKLSENEISSIPRQLFSKLARLTTLDLSRNFLHHITRGTFQGLRKLEWLELRSNMFHFLTPDMFRGLKNLHNLRLDKNPLLDIEAGTFAEMKKLQSLSLDVAGNMTITSDAFRGMKNLQTLSFGEISRETLPNGVFTSMKSLSHLSIVVHGGKFRGLTRDHFWNKMDFRKLKVWTEPIHQCRCNVDWIRRLVEMGAFVHGSCGTSQQIRCNSNYL